MNNISLCSPNECTGCMACYSVCSNEAISIQTNNEGFYIPLIDESKCIQCHKCEISCPSLNPIPAKSFSQYGYACWSKNFLTRKHSSSGGLFTEIATTVINRGGLVYGAAFDDDFKVVHTSINNLQDIPKLRGSKYVQSYIGNSFKSVERDLKNNHLVLFVGTPCQVSGLHRYLRNDYSNLILCDFVCHGTPSPKVFECYKNWLEKKHQSQLNKFHFRDKKFGWSNFNVKGVFKNGKEYIGTWHKDPYLRLFLRELTSRPSCYECKYTNMQRPSDITIADFWGLHFDKKENGKHTDEGISLALINSKKGETLFKDCKEELYYIERTSQIIQSSQKSFSSPWTKPILREQFWKDFRISKFEKIISQYAYPEKIRLSKKIIYILGKNRVSSLLCKILTKCHL